MAKVWVRALGVCHYEESGVQKVAQPGDWFEAGKADARQWLAEGKIDIPDIKKKTTVQELADCGVSLRGPNATAIAEALRQQFPGLAVSGGVGLTHPRCLLWDVSARLRTELIPIGLGLLQTWHLAVPLLDYDTLARDIGGDEDRRRTQDLLHDLRVPVYDTRIIFARKCQDVERLLSAWQQEKEQGFGVSAPRPELGTKAQPNGSDERLAFLRALHRVIPLINALPPIWLKQ